GSATGGRAAKRRAILERFREEHGDKRLAPLPKDFIVALVDTMAPPTARNWLKTFRHFIRWCESRKLISGDPTWGVKVKIPHSDGRRAWSEAEILQFETFHPFGSKARLAITIGLCTALRRGDVVRLGQQHIKNGEQTIELQKTKVPLTITVMGELAAVIAATPSGHLTLLTTKSGKSYGANDFSEQFRKWCDDAGLPSD